MNSPGIELSPRGTERTASPEPASPATPLALPTDTLIHVHDDGEDLRPSSSQLGDAASQLTVNGAASGTAQTDDDAATLEAKRSALLLNKRSLSVMSRATERAAAGQQQRHVGLPPPLPPAADGEPPYLDSDLDRSRGPDASAPELSTSRIFASFVHSETLGPPAANRFHRVSVWRRLVHALLTVALLGGLALFFTIMLCVLMSVGYLAFHSPAPFNVTAAAMIFYVFAFLGFSRTILRTALRILVWLWTAPLATKSARRRPKSAESWGLLFVASPRQFASTLLDVIVDGTVSAIMWVYSLIPSLSSLATITPPWQQQQPQPEPEPQVEPLDLASPTSTTTNDGARAQSPSTVTLVPDTDRAIPPSSPPPPPPPPVPAADTAASLAETRANLGDYIRYLLHMVFLTVIIVIPVILAALNYGYYGVVSSLSVASIASAVAVVFLVNLTARLHRTMRFLLILAKAPVPNDRRLAMYVASVGQDAEINLADSIIEQVLRLALLLLVGIIFLNGLRRMVLVNILMVVIGGLLFLRLRHLFKGCCSRRRGKGGAAKSADPIDLTPVYEHFDGRNYRTPLGVMFTRLVVTIVGLLAVASLDVANEAAERGIDLSSGPPPPPDARWLNLLIAYLITYFSKDVALIVTPIPSWFASVLLSLSLLGRVAIAALAVLQFNMPVSATTLVVLSYLSIDMCDGRAFWTNRGSMRGRRRFRRATTKAMLTLALVVGTVLVSVVLGYLVGLQQQQETDRASGVNHIENINFPNATRAFPVCTARYGGDGQFSLVDMVTMSGAAYFNSDADVANLISRNARLRDDAVLAAANFTDTVGVRAIEFRFKSAPNVSVVAVRGTSTTSDVWEDIHLWSTPILLQSSTYVGTMVGLWPRAVTAELVRFVSRYLAFNAALYYTEVDAYVGALQAQGRQVVVTGHSLGGGIASIVGARRSVPAVAVSAPGLGMSYLNYELSLDAVSQWPVNVVPFTDPVPKCDEQVGAVVHVPCNSVVPVDCHYWRQTLRTLLEMCSGTTMTAAGTTAA
ncbi:hypothetical protein H9P43_004459 [Blastocladiella emersonii ATCC 22665]|nr:hypothetical protein H9P43_004459 [Blastocladiella emersonii ATCC 22665]